MGQICKAILGSPTNAEDRTCTNKIVKYNRDNPGNECASKRTVSEKAVCYKDKVIDPPQSKLSASGSLGVHYISAGDFNSPAANLKVKFSGKTSSVNGVYLKLSGSVNGGRSFREGEGKADETLLFGPGPMSKLGDGSLNIGAKVSAVLGDEETAHVALSYGVVGDVIYPEDPLPTVLAIAASSAGGAQQGFGLTAQSPMFSDSIQLSGLLTYGSAIDSLKLIGGKFDYVRHSEGDQKGEAVKQFGAGLAAKLKLGEKVSLISAYNYIKTFGDQETASHSFGFGTRIGLQGGWSLGGDVHLDPVLEPDEGQKEKSAYSIAAQIAYTAGVHTFKLSGGLHNRTSVRTLMENSAGAPTMGTPEDSVTETALREIGMTYEFNAWSARLAYVDVPGGSGLAFYSTYKF